MAEDMGPGTVVEVYRGRAVAPMELGSRWTIAKVYDAGPEWGPCGDCLPGFDAPSIVLVEIPKTADPDWVLCSCCFRPVRKPPPAAIERDARICEDA